MGAEDAVNDVDVVERADGAVQFVGVLGRCDAGELIEEFVVGLGFLGEEGGQEAHDRYYEFDSILRTFYNGEVPKTL